MKLSVAVCVGVIALVLSAGCAEVDVYKIGLDGAPVGPSGVRFNRPRPYVAVHEPFIVGARAYLVKGQVSPDGKFVLITSSTDQLDGTLRSALGEKIEGSRVLLAIPPSTSGGVPGGVQAATESTEPSTPSAKSEPTEGVGGGQQPAQAEKTGQGQFKVINDNNAFAVQPLRRYCDIVYLQDFEEEFVVQVKQRMGIGSAQLALGQSWSLQGLDARVDNDAITRRLFSLYDESIKIALQLGKAALGIPGIPGGVQAAKDVRTAAQLPAGINVTIKVTTVRMVAPGVYPILKPAEGKFVIENLARLRQLMPELDRRLLIPVYPMTNVAFNTYESVVLEAAAAAGDSPLRLQQYIDTTGEAQSNKGALTPVPGAATNLQNERARKGLENAIASSLNAKDKTHTYTATITPLSNNEGTVVVDKGGGTLTPAAIKAAVAEAANKQGVKLILKNQVE
jgi:hypothetical protein